MSIHHLIKSLVFGIIVCTCAMGNAQKVNAKKGIAIQGYDVVSYFEGTPIKGNKNIQSVYKNTTYLFSTTAHKSTFDKSPENFLPAYGGFCAYAVAKTGEKVAINPKTYEIRSGKLYLFYNAWGTNTLKSWQKENPLKLIEQADINWRNLK